MLFKKRLEYVLVFFCYFAVVFMLPFSVVVGCGAISPKIAGITISAIITTGVSFFHNYII